MSKISVINNYKTVLIKKIINRLLPPILSPADNKDIIIAGGFLAKLYVAISDIVSYYSGGPDPITYPAEFLEYFTLEKLNEIIDSSDDRFFTEFLIYPMEFYAKEKILITSPKDIIGNTPHSSECNKIRYKTDIDIWMLDSEKIYTYLKFLETQNIRTISDFYKLMIISSMKNSVLFKGSHNTESLDNNNLKESDVFSDNLNHYYISKFEESLFAYNTNLMICNESMLFESKIQLIKKIPNNVFTLLESFDVSIAQIAYYNGNIYVSDDFLKSMNIKEFYFTDNQALKINNYEHYYSVYLANRYIKYIEFYNFTPSEDIVKFIFKTYQNIDFTLAKADSYKYLTTATDNFDGLIYKKLSKLSYPTHLSHESIKFEVFCGSYNNSWIVNKINLMDIAKSQDINMDNLLTFSSRAMIERQKYGNLIEHLFKIHLTDYAFSADINYKNSLATMQVSQVASGYNLGTESIEIKNVIDSFKEKITVDNDFSFEKSSEFSQFSTITLLNNFYKYFYFGVKKKFLKVEELFLFPQELKINIDILNKVSNVKKA